MKKIKKIFAILLLLTMSLILMPQIVSGDENDDSLQIASNGSFTYWDEDGKPSNASAAWVAVSKTIQDSNMNSDLEENQFIITLDVKTKMDLTEVTIYQDAAVVLVLDRSASMFMIPGVEATDPTKQNPNNGSSTYYPSYNEEGVYDLEAGYERSRMYELKEALKTFIEAYSAPGEAERWISVVYFDTIAEAQQMNDNYWVNVSTKEGMDAFYNLIYGYGNTEGNHSYNTGGLQPQAISTGSFSSLPRGYTNIEAGFAVARNLYIPNEQNEQSNIFNCNVILFTDGVPTYYGRIDTSYDNTTFFDFTEQNTVSSSNSAQQASRIHARVDQIKEIGADVYAIGYADAGTSILNQIGAKLVSGGTEETGETEETLDDIFLRITKSIESFSEAWTVTDPMGRDSVINFQ